MAERPTGNPDALHLLGLQICETVRSERGIQLLRKVTTATPQRRDIQSDLGNALKRAGLVHQAIGFHRSVAEALPGSAGRCIAVVQSG